MARKYDQGTADLWPDSSNGIGMPGNGDSLPAQEEVAYGRVVVPAFPRRDPGNPFAIAKVRDGTEFDVGETARA